MDHNFDNHPFGFRDYRYLGIRALVIYKYSNRFIRFPALEEGTLQ